MMNKEDLSLGERLLIVPVGFVFLLIFLWLCAVGGLLYLFFTV